MMQQTLKVDVLGARRVNVDGQTYAKLFLGQIEDDANVRGLIPMTLSCESGVIDQLDGVELPRQMEVRVRLQLAGGGKTGMHALSVHPDTAGGSASASGAGAPAAGNGPGSTGGATRPQSPPKGS